MKGVGLVLVALLAVAGCSSSHDDGGALGATAITSCPVSPEVPAAPDGVVPVRRDLTPGASGAVAVRLTVVDADHRCRPRPGLTVEVWDPAGSGAQRTNDAGTVGFSTAPPPEGVLHVRVLDGQRVVHAGTVPVDAPAVLAVHLGR